jgi:hypothetical protein
MCRYFRGNEIPQKVVKLSNRTKNVVSIWVNFHVAIHDRPSSASLTFISQDTRKKILLTLLQMFAAASL